jgi:PAS domain S-box-containing protein
MDDLLNTAPCGFLTFADDGTILVTNARLRERLGYSAGELEGRSVETILSVGGRVFYHTHFFPLLKMQGSAEEIYFSLKSKSGDEIPALVNAARRERGGQTVNDCVLVQMRQRHKYEDELLRARNAAEQASEAKAKFLSMMSHDLRTPLQAISGYADVLALEMRGPINDEQREDVGAIKAASQEMMRLISDILSFAQLESGRVEVRIAPVVIGDALNRAESLLRMRFDQQGLTFERSACPDDLVVAADPDRLQQILLNLMTNAIKFTAPGGKISVTCEAAGSSVRIHVADTGIGIPEDRVKDIFEPFVQVHGEKAPAGPRGVGLGLAISRELARAMGGDLTATSSPGRGSVFTITLPAAERRVEAV